MPERSEDEVLRKLDSLNIRITFSEILHSRSLVRQILQKMIQTANRNTYMSEPTNSLRFIEHPIPTCTLCQTYIEKITRISRTINKKRGHGRRVVLNSDNLILKTI